MPITGSQKALMFAQSGRARAGATRADYHNALVYLTVAGVQRRANVLMPSITISDIVDETPNTCSFIMYGVKPTVGQEVVIMLGSSNNQDRLFGGHILNVTQTPQGKPSILFYRVNAIDYTWLLNRRKVTKRYQTQTAATILADLVASFTSGFTINPVATGLSVLIDEMTFTNEDVTDALTRLAKLIGGYWYADYLKVIHVYTGTESGQTGPIDLTSAHISMNDVSLMTDNSQIATRVLFEGGGSRTLAACAAGETAIPIEEAAWYNDAGGTVVSGPQRITYAAVNDGGPGSIIGPGVTPSAAPALALVGGSGVTDGTHTWGYAWVTAAGETLPSPIATIATGTLPTPASAPTGAQYVDHIGYGRVGYAIGDTLVFKYTYASDDSLTHDTAAGPTSGSVTIEVAPDHGSPWMQQVSITGAHSTDAKVTKIHVWVSHNGGAYVGTTSITNVPSGGTWFTTFFGMMGDSTGIPSANPNVQQVALSSIAVGPSGTTSRKVYRTAIGSAQLKLVATIADNTTTTYTDSTADGSLGANAASSDTSGLTQPSGQVSPGATSIPTAGVAFASVTGGWVIIGNGQQVIRYTGISGNALTGVPASGAGAIIAAVNYGSTITGAPMLTGIPATGTGRIVYPILEGDDVNVLAIVNDVGAQAVLAAQIGGDGIQEEYLQDRRFSETESTARALSVLALHGSSMTTLSYHARDQRTKSGATITVSLGSPTSISGAYKIQRVTISEIGMKSTLFPRYDVEASQSRFSFENLLQVIRTGTVA